MSNLPINELKLAKIKHTPKQTLQLLSNIVKNNKFIFSTEVIVGKRGATNKKNAMPGILGMAGKKPEEKGKKKKPRKKRGETGKPGKRKTGKTGRKRSQKV